MRLTLEQFQAAFKAGHHKLGMRRAHRDSRTLQLRNYLVKASDGSLPAPAVAVDWTKQVPDWPMYGNDQLGDCVEAASGHMIQVWEAYAQNSTTNIPTLGQIIQAYEGAAGYNPADPATDQGTDPLTFLKYWKSAGVGGHKIGAYAMLTTGDLTEFRLAIQLFGAAFVGLAMPTAMQGANHWHVIDNWWTDGSPGNQGSWGGHMVAVPKYDDTLPLSVTHLRNTAITWGEELLMTDYFYQIYGTGSWVVFSQDWIESDTNEAPNLIDKAALLADLEAVTKA